MRKSYREENGEKVFRYSIRKYHFGAASVAIAALMFFANGAVKADPLPVSPATANTENVNAGVTNLTEGVPLEKSLEAEGNKEIVAPEPAEKTSNKKDGAGSSAQGAKEIKVSDKAVIPADQTEEINKAETNGKEKEVVTNKDKLESLLKEIDQLNLKDYTEDTVKVLQEKVAKAKEVSVNAKSQKEIDLAYNALVGYKNAGLKRVPKPKGELTPKPDTTNGKATVGIKAENTEPDGTNIAGHNHSLAGTSLPEGSSFRTAPAGDVTFYHLDGSMETEAGRAPDARYILKFRRGRGYRPQYTSATTTGAYLDYTGQRIEGEFLLRTFATRGSDAEVGSYDFRLRFTDSSTGEIYVDQVLKVNVKPNKPTVTVENLENAAGKRAVVKSTARNSNDSIVEFYLNNTKKATITAVNGTASWTPDEALQAGDRITTRNIARDREYIPATYGGNINVARSTSDMSDAVTIPKAPKPTTPVAPTVASDEANARVTVTPSANADKVEINIGTDKVVATKTGSTWSLSPAKDGVSVNPTSGVITVAHNAASAGTQVSATAKHGNSDASSSASATLPAKETTPVAPTVASDEANARVTVTPSANADKVEINIGTDKVVATKTAGEAAIPGAHNNGDLEELKTAAKVLPNTGTVKSTLAIPVAIISALLSLGLVGERRRKENEEI